MGIVDWGFNADRKVELLAVRMAEVEARLARTEKALARQRRVNQALLSVMEGMPELQAMLDQVQAIE